MNAEGDFCGHVRRRDNGRAQVAAHHAAARTKHTEGKADGRDGRSCCLLFVFCVAFFKSVCLRVKE